MRMSRWPVVAEMAAGANGIGDTDLLRHGAVPGAAWRLAGAIHAGLILTGLHLGQRAAIGQGAPGVPDGGARCALLLPGADVLAFVEIDSQQKRVHREYAKQGATFGHRKMAGKSLLMRGLNVLPASICIPLATPVIVGTRRHGDNAASARGAVTMITEAGTTARTTSCTGTRVVRMDSAFCGAPASPVARKARVHFSVTVRIDPRVSAAIARRPGRRLDAVQLPCLAGDDQPWSWISGAQVAET